MPAPRPEAPAAALDPWLWGAVATGAGVRTWLLWLYPDFPLGGDPMLHYVKGVLVAAYGTGHLGHWAPGYETFLGTLFAFAGPDPSAARAAQIVLSVGTVGLVYAIARNAGGIRAGRIAAGLCALHPTLVAYTHYLYGETLYLALLCGAVWVLHRRDGRSTPTELAAGGVLFGLAGLTRSVGLYFLPLWVVWEMVRGRYPRALQAGIVLVLAFAVVLPWTLRNLEKYEAFVLVDGTFGPTAWFAYKEVPFNRDLGFHRRDFGRSTCPDERIAGPDPLPRVREMIPLFMPLAPSVRSNPEALFRYVHSAKEKGTRDVAKRQACELGNYLEFATSRPGRMAWLAGWRLYGFWGPNSFLLRAVHHERYPQRGPMAREWYGAWKAVVVATCVGLGLAALLAFGRRRPPLVEWCALFIGYYTAVHMLAVAYSRYRLPVVPLVIVLAALWLADPHRPEGRTRTWTVSALSLGFLAMCSWYVVARLP